MTTQTEALKLALEALETDWGTFGAIAAIKEALAQPEQEPTYASTQATNCAGCGEHKHTPLRIDAMGGYVCLTCIDKKLGTLLGEFGYPEPEQEPVEITITGKLGNIYSFTGDYSLKKGDKVYTTPPQRKPLTDDREVFKRYIEECDECAIVPDVAGAFNAGWQAAHGIKE